MKPYLYDYDFEQERPFRGYIPRDQQVELAEPPHLVFIEVPADMAFHFPDEKGAELYEKWRSLFRCTVIDVISKYLQRPLTSDDVDLIILVSNDPLKDEYFLAYNGKVLGKIISTFTIPNPNVIFEPSVELKK